MIQIIQMRTLSLCHEGVPEHPICELSKGELQFVSLHLVRYLPFNKEKKMHCCHLRVEQSLRELRA